MKGSEFVFDYVDLFYYKCYKINPNHDGSYIESPDWIKNKKATINPVKKDIKCFQHTVKVALNHKEIGKYSERITKIRSFINKYNWEGINFPLEKDSWKKFKKNNRKFLLIFCMLKRKKYFLLMFQNITQITKNRSFF